MSHLYPVPDFSEFTPEVIAAMAPAQAGAMGNKLFSRLKRAGVASTFTVSRPYGPEEQAAWAVVNALKARGNSPEPVAPVVEFEVVEEAPRPRRSMLHSRRAKK